MDTARLARVALHRDEVRNCKLATLAAHFRTTVTPTHRAFDDARATAELDQYRRAMGEAEFLRLTGTGYSQQLVGPKLMWLRAHERDLFARARHVLGASDYITFRLGGALQVEHNWALESGFVNIATGAIIRKIRRSPSAIRLTPMTSTAIAAAGAQSDQGAWRYSPVF